MSDVLETLAADATKLLVFLGVAVAMVGGTLGVDVAVAVGLVLLIGAQWVGPTIGDALMAYADGAGDATSEDPVEALRERYARGELTEAEFEQKLERLLETEGMEASGGVGDREVGEAETVPERE
jgi:uncharacterized membrane protein